MDGEKPSKYLSSLETQTYLDKTIRKLIRDDGSTLTDQNTILTEVQNFYAELFREQPCKGDLNLLDHLVGSKHFKTLSSDESNSLENDITLGELSNALKI